MHYAEVSIHHHLEHEHWHHTAAGVQQHLSDQIQQQSVMALIFDLPHPEHLHFEQ